MNIPADFKERVETRLKVVNGSLDFMFQYSRLNPKVWQSRNLLNYITLQEALLISEFLLCPLMDLLGDTRKKEAVLEECNWSDHPFKMLDEGGDHDPVYLVMPGGSMVSFAHNDNPLVDPARVRFIVDACNEKLERLVHDQ